jgi:hypothetical protein
VTGPRPEWDCWPDLRVTVRLFPWHWRLRPWLYVDDNEGARGHWSLEWLAVTVEWWGQGSDSPLFPMEDRQP